MKLVLKSALSYPLRRTKHIVMAAEWILGFRIDLDWVGLSMIRRMLIKYIITRS